MGYIVGGCCDARCTINCNMIISANRRRQVTLSIGLNDVRTSFTGIYFATDNSTHAVSASTRRTFYNLGCAFSDGRIVENRRAVASYYEPSANIVLRRGHAYLPARAFAEQKVVFGMLTFHVFCFAKLFYTTVWRFGPID